MKSAMLYSQFNGRVWFSQKSAEYCEYPLTYTHHEIHIEGGGFAAVLMDINIESSYYQFGVH